MTLFEFKASSTWKTIEEQLESSKTFSWPLNFAYAVYGDSALNFNEDQLSGLLYGAEIRKNQDFNEKVHGEEYATLMLYFKEGMSKRQIGMQLGISDSTVTNRLMVGLWSLRYPAYGKYVSYGLSACLAKEQAVKDREKYLDEHPLERGLCSWCEKANLSFKAYQTASNLEDAGFKTLGDFVNGVVRTSKNPYKNIQGSVKGLGPKRMRELVESLRTVVDIPPCDRTDLSHQTTTARDPRAEEKPDLSQLSFEQRLKVVQSAAALQTSTAEPQRVSTDSIAFTFTKKELQMVISALDMIGDRLADREGYSSGKPYWDLKEKLEGLERSAKDLSSRQNEPTL